MADRDLTCDLGTFAATLDQLVGDIPDSCNEGCQKAVRQSTRKTAKGLRAGEAVALAVSLEKIPPEFGGPAVGHDGFEVGSGLPVQLAEAVVAAGEEIEKRLLRSRSDE